jgi:putative ATP-dependent endonuclease of OLD family
MRLARVCLRNFRCYEDDTWIDTGELAVLVGRNDAGKSAVFDALAIFFGNSKLDSGDACIYGDGTDVRIICEFEDFPESLVIDANYPTTLADEYLLNERGALEIHKVYDGSLKTPKLRGTYARALHPSAQNANDLLQLKNSDLKDRATQLGVDTQSIDTRVNTQLRPSTEVAGDPSRRGSSEKTLGTTSDIPSLLCPFPFGPHQYGSRC